MRIRNAVMPLLLGLLCPLAMARDDGSVPEIRAVWDLSTQPCNGGGGNTMSRNPLQEGIQKSGVVDLPGLNVSFRIPAFADLPHTIIKLYLGDRSRGVTDNYILLSDQDLAPPTGAVVVTELPPNFDADKAFLAVATLQRQLSAGSGYTPALEKITGPYGAALEMRVPNRVGTACFPTSRMQRIPAGNSLQTMGISRFIFMDGRLVEFALIVRFTPDMKSDEQRNAYARNAMNVFWGGLTIR